MNQKTQESQPKRKRGRPPKKKSLDNQSCATSKVISSYRLKQL